jgi:hypothetical protein
MTGNAKISNAIIPALIGPYGETAINAKGRNTTFLCVQHKNKQYFPLM